MNIKTVFENLIWVFVSIMLVSLWYFSLQYLYQARKASIHVYVCTNIAYVYDFFIGLGAVPTIWYSFFYFLINVQKQIKVKLQRYDICQITPCMLSKLIYSVYEINNKYFTKYFLIGNEFSSHFFSESYFVLKT